MGWGGRRGGAGSGCGGGGEVGAVEVTGAARGGKTVEDHGARREGELAWAKAGAWWGRGAAGGVTAGVA